MVRDRSVGLWIFRASLRAFPRSFRARYGERLVADFLDRYAEQTGRARRARFVLAAAADAVGSGLRERSSGGTGDIPSSLAQGVSAAYRGLRRAPAVTLAVVVTLALGIGANTTMFGVADRLLLRPPEHVVNADRVVQIHIERMSPFTRRREITPSFAYPDLGDMQPVDAFEAVAGFGRATRTLGSGENAERVRVQLADAALFPLLGVQPLLGRFYGPDEDRVEGGARVAVLSHGFWTRRFGEDPDVLGRDLEIGTTHYTVVGVTPAGFSGPSIEPVDVFLPLRTGQAAESGTRWVDARRWYWLAAVARLADGASIEAAEAEATAAHRAGRAEEVAAGRYDETAHAVLGSLIPGQGAVVGAEIEVSRWLVGVSIVVLLIACANVANLLLLRALRRRRELAVRIALGATRVRVMGEAVGESLLLASIAGLAALLAARWGSALVYRTLLPDLDPGAQTAGWRLVAFTVAAAVAAALLAGMVPAVQASRADVTRDLKEGARGSTASGRLRSALLMVQVALSALLLVGASLFLRSLAGVQRLDLGFEPEGVLVGRIEASDGWFTDESSAAVVATMERLRGAPGVANAAVVSLAPLNGMWGLTLLRSEGDTIDVPRGPFYYAASADYFSTLGMRVLRGRGFTEADMGAGAPPVAVLSESLARRAFGAEDAVGRCVMIEGQEPLTCTRVVGVIADHAAEDLVEDEALVFYLPVGHPAAQKPQTLVVKAAGAAAALAPTVRQALLESIPGVRYASVAPLGDAVASRSRSWRLGATLFSLFGALALGVASLGLYALVGFDVAQRRAELGVRSALGAPRRRLVWSVVAATVGRTAFGLALGLGAAVVLARHAEDLLFQVRPTDTVAIVSAAALLVGVASLAAMRPAVSAARVSPTEALRTE